MESNSLVMGSNSLTCRGPRHRRPIERYPRDTRDELRAREHVDIDMEDAVCVNENKAHVGLAVVEYRAQYQAKYKKHMTSWGGDPKSSNNLQK